MWDAGLQIGEVVDQTYLRIADDLAQFESNLPLVVINTYDLGMPDKDVYTYIAGTMSILEPVSGVSTLASAVASTDNRIGIKVRGSSSRDHPKKSYTVETWDHLDDDKEVAVLDMPEESDWVF